MSLKISHSSFEINLDDSSFTMVEENNWFTDSFVAKYTYPFTLSWTRELKIAFQFLNELSTAGVNTLYDVVFFAFEMEHEAVLEIKEASDINLVLEVRYGLEEFPNYGKKLAELPLHNFELDGENIYAHALNKIPLLNQDYNFPAVHTEAFDTDSEQWEFFEGLYNNFDGTNFRENTYDGINDIQQNRNVMQPMPSLLYVLKKGFEDAGYTLVGDVVDDADIKKQLLQIKSDYYSTIQDVEKTEVVVKSDEYAELIDQGTGVSYGRYAKVETVTGPGRYRISGNLFIRAYGFVFVSPANATLKFNGEYLATYGTFDREKFILVDHTVDILPGQVSANLEFYSLQYHRPTSGGTVVEDATILDITITKLTSYGVDGAPEPTLINPTTIDLTKCVPDITFGALHTFVKNLKNFETIINGDTIAMNYIRPKAIDNVPVDMEFSEVRHPRRKFNKGKSFVLKYADSGSEEYESGAILIDGTGVTTKPFTEPKDAKTTLIDGILLPVITKSSKTTAFDHSNTTTKIQLVEYNGLQGGYNFTVVPIGLNIHELYAMHYSTWFDFLLNGVTFIWRFYATMQKLKELRVNRQLFAYGTYHIPTRLSRQKISDQNVLVEIETTAL